MDNGKGHFLRRTVLTGVLLVMIFASGWAFAEKNIVIPDGFDIRTDEDADYLYLARENEWTKEEWVFSRNGEDWMLKEVRSIRHDGQTEDEIPTVTESYTEVFDEIIHSSRRMKNQNTDEVLYIYWEASFPNVLNMEDCFLSRIDFNSSPVCADGYYNWSWENGACPDPEVMPRLFNTFFPDYTYVDGLLTENGWLEFIGRKDDGIMVLLCGADEGETGWEWTESTPLPEGVRFGCENFTDALNLNAYYGGCYVSVQRLEKGKWSISYVNGTDFFVGPEWVGMYGSETNAQFFGNHAWGDITTIDWMSLPPEEYRNRETKTEKDARISAMVDRTDWATPAHSNPEAKTELFGKAGEGSTLLGRFFDGTPMYVLERGTEWTRVRIGSGEGQGVMTGWVRTEELVFGDDTLNVSRENMRIHSEKFLIHPVETFAGSRAGQLTAVQFGSSLIIGETDSDEAIVYYLPTGDVGLIPCSALWNGNG